MSDLDREMLDLAARAGRRAQGRVEPNPLVGCVIASPDDPGLVIACGHHREFGGPHAEIDALRNAAQQGEPVAGATVYVTLEPCAHQGKTPPCVDALIEARVGEVVIARRDPHPSAKGGAEALRRAGIAVRFTDASEHATRLSDPFCLRVEEGRPWVIAKWAQTLDGRVATRTGDSKWISGERSRAMVHRWRGRVDAVLTGVGTVVADDPMLTARAPRPARRVALRAVVDPSLRTPPGATIVRTAYETPVVLFCEPDAADRADALRDRGVVVVPIGPDRHDPARLDLREAMEWLARERGATNVLLEAGPGLLSSMLRADLIDEARVFVSPVLLGDRAAIPAFDLRPLDRLADARRVETTGVRRIGDDALLTLRFR
ncbi:MAG: bifunctional diaminohydroxyphosphoribosylaminopyrimidine deaminase/5-amino-6-(5-phosphoribosylamino)uracil reductase RibD [Phycisphaeraceae bacterium]|nr:bifunctional diaminohydroxyphosphoribosylaminopyrimidine deaminase/5-amino-6-(5-phosphoribosylamino)uracil reductase RibD [Phycisphaeraceae bacterium]